MPAMVLELDLPEVEAFLDPALVGSYIDGVRRISGV
jgi:hypothetical protein